MADALRGVLATSAQISSTGNGNGIVEEWRNGELRRKAIRDAVLGELGAIAGNWPVYEDTQDPDCRFRSSTAQIIDQTIHNSSSFLLLVR